MTNKWNVKVIDLEDKSTEHVASFCSSELACAYKAKLNNGSGGLFGRNYEIIVEESIEKKRGKYAGKEVYR